MLIKNRPDRAKFVRNKSVQMHFLVTIFMNVLVTFMLMDQTYPARYSQGRLL